MGKLHSLKRAIKKNPDAWHFQGRVRGAFKKGTGEWVPQTWFAYGPHSYKKFVKKVLEDIRGRSS